VPRVHLGYCQGDGGTVMDVVKATSLVRIGTSWR
jgi:hypothetical protein